MKTTLTILTLGFAQFARATSHGYFESSTCVDRSAFEKCFDSADASFINCANNYCGGGDSVCVRSCNGDPACVWDNCPSLGIDCLNVCECILHTDRVACAAGSCWNQAYSCEYQKTVGDALELCGDMQLDSIPYWPAPESAPGSCSCNIGEMTLTQLKAGNQALTCMNDTAILSNLSTDEIRDRAKACQCCQSSYIESAFWEMCPSTQPSLLGADAFAGLFDDFAECEQLMQKYECASTLGFGAAVGDAMSSYYVPGGFPKNGTETLYNSAGALSFASAATILWTSDASITRTIIAAQASEGAVKGGATTSSATSGSGSRATGPVPSSPSASATAVSTDVRTSEGPRMHVSWFMVIVAMIQLACI